MLQIAICDDEKKDLLHMRTLVEEVMDHFSVRYDIQNFENGEELLECPVPFDLIFMDIRLNGENGIETGKKIYWKNRNVKIIFQTYLAEECSNAVNKSHAFAFLTKPVDGELLKKQIEEFMRSRENMQEMWISFCHVRWIDAGDKSKTQNVRMAVRDIIYFEVIKGERSVKAVTKKGIFCYAEKFEELEERMQSFGFETCSRGIMVNLDQVMKREKREVKMSNGECLPLSQRRNRAFRERMNEFFCSSTGK